MKRKLCPPLIAASLILLVSCNSSASKEDMNQKLQNDAQKALQQESKNEDATPGTAALPAEAITVADAIKFIAAGNRGKQITIKGYPRGATKPVNGSFMLYVSDKTGSGPAEENFACYMNEDAREQVKKLKGNELLSVTGNIAYNGGMVVLRSARFAE